MGQRGQGAGGEQTEGEEQLGVLEPWPHSVTTLT